MAVRIDLTRARREAKARVKAGRAASLSAAQLAVARELGARSWPALVRMAAEQPADPRHALYAATAAGDRDAVLALIADGVRVAPSMALTAALDRNDDGMLAFLLAHAPTLAKNDAWDELRFSVHAAIERSCSAAVVALLLDHGAEVPPGAHREAVRFGRDDVAALLPADREVSDPDRFAGACVAGDLERARALASDEGRALLRGAASEALPRAAAAGRADAVRALVEVGGVPVDRRGEGGLSALQLAAGRGHDDVVALLLRLGAEPDLPTPHDRAAPPGAGVLDVELDAAYLKFLATQPGARVLGVDDAVAIRTGIEDNSANGVVSRGEVADPEALAAFVGSVPARWLVPAGAGPELRAALLALGAEEERSAITMAARVAELAFLDAAPPAGVSIPGDAALVARADGVETGRAEVFVHGDAVALRELEVTPAERHRGIGRALIAHALRDARAGGAVTAIVAPTPESRAYYALLGFGEARIPRNRVFYLP